MRWALVLCGVLGMGLSGAVGEQGTAKVISAATSHNLTIPVDRGWQFRQVKTENTAESGWMAANVPGDVHLDLLRNKQIPDPFFRDNESKLQWIEKESWEYKTSFEVSAATLKRAHLDLVFDGLDGPSTVWLNGAQVLTTSNSFRIWRVSAKVHLRVGKNTLRVVFASPITAAEEMGKHDPWIAKSKTEPKTLLRKPAYEYGWDWGPRFVTSGIWRPVRLEVWDKLRIEDVAVRQHTVTKDAAQVTAQISVVAAQVGKARLRLSYAGEGGKPVNVVRNVEVKAGSNLVEIPIAIHQPSLWYPAGYGEQPLYNFTAQAVGADEKTVKVGLRSVVLRRQPDKWGKSFELVVNGIPVFAKGADVIPFDSFPNRVTTADYRRILESARDANMNMIRHWGGGYYESEEFYSICDELGLMVWQDFQFGNDWQPGNASFKQNVDAEARDQVRRLRNHPSIVLWCGNNETELAYNWGVHAMQTPDIRAHIWQDYMALFSGVLKRVVADLNAETPYWPSSPSSNYEKVTATYHTGDEHIWDVWHGRVPFSTYETHHARFVTEYGFQSFPEMKTVESFTEPSDRANIFTPVMLAHQKNNEGNSIIDDYMRRDYGEPKDFSSFLYASQVLQAEGIKIGAEYFRRSRPQTMGSVYWQLNDCWPVASWSSIDYYGRWKALQYYARRFYAPVLVSPHVENGALKVYIVSDLTRVPAGTNLRVRVMEMDGKTLLDEMKPVAIAPLTSKVYLDLPLKRLADVGAADTTKVFVVAEAGGGETPIVRNIAYLGPVKAVRLKPAPLALDAVAVRPASRDKEHRVWSASAKKFEVARNLYTVKISSPVLARSIYLSFGDAEVETSDNYFDLLPGETREIEVWSNASLEAIRLGMRALSLVDAFEGGGAARPSIVAAH